MSIVRMCTLQCDRCDAMEDESFWTAYEARASGRTDGWTRTRQGDICPRCNQIARGET